MLERLHLDYLYLSSFAHSLQAANMAKTLYDERSTERLHFSEAEVGRHFQFEVNTNARAYSFIAIAQSAAELIVLYPNDMELAAAVSDAWQDSSGVDVFPQNLGVGRRFDSCVAALDANYHCGAP